MKIKPEKRWYLKETKLIYNAPFVEVVTTLVRSSDGGVVELVFAAMEETVVVCTRSSSVIMVSECNRVLKIGFDVFNEKVKVIYQFEEFELSTFFFV